MNLSARWILLDIPPGSTPPCTARFGFESTSGDYQVLGDVVVAPCRDVPEALERCNAVLEMLAIPKSPVFTLLYPRYAVEGALEGEMHEIAWVIKDEADKRGWHFAREMPLATRHIVGGED